MLARFSGVALNKVGASARKFGWVTTVTRYPRTPWLVRVTSREKSEIWYLRGSEKQTLIDMRNVKKLTINKEGNLYKDVGVSFKGDADSYVCVSGPHEELVRLEQAFTDRK
jgi:hypothetical protein